MAQTEGIMVFGGLYGSSDEAMEDFNLIKAAHDEKWLGFYEAAAFSKDADGKVKILDIDSTTRGAGAKIGAVTGAIFGVIFPPSLIASAVVGAAVGGVAGNLAKGFGKGDIKELAESLEPGQAGVVLVAEMTPEEGIERYMKRAKKIAKQTVDADAKALKEEIDAL